MAEFKCTECGWEGENTGVYTEMILGYRNSCTTRCLKCNGKVYIKRWSRTLPAEPGWYWLRNFTIGKYKIDEPAIAVKVDYYCGLVEDAYLGCEIIGYIGSFSVIELDGEWQGPIKPKE